MNRNYFDVPPLIDVPADVRDRIQARVLPRLSEQERRPRTTAWIAAAAAAGVFVAGGLVMVVSQPEVDAPKPVLDTDVSAQPLDRCWRSAQQQEPVAKYPDRSTWQSVLTVEGPKSTVTALRANGKPLFCETTLSGVTLSAPDADPAYADGTRTGGVLVTDTGTVAGVADPSWRRLYVMGNAANGDGYGGEARVADGLFVYQAPMNAVQVKVSPDDATWLTLPKPSPPFGTVEPGFTPGDRASAAGKQLGQCLDAAKAGGETGEIASWNPGAIVEHGGQRLVMMVNAAGVGACYQQSQRTQLMPYLGKTVSGKKPDLLPVAPTVGGLSLTAGQAPPEATSLRMTFTDNSTKDISVTAGTFAVLSSPNAGPPVSCVLFDRNNREIYAGPCSN
jgi:hypothetical protein